MLISGFQKRSIVDQIDTFGFDLDLSLNNLNGSCSVGFSGSEIAAFNFISGKVYDFENHFVGAYQADEQINILGTVGQSVYDYSINGEQIALGYPCHSGKYSWLFINPSPGIVADIDINISGNVPDYSVMGSGNFYGSGSTVTGYIFNESSGVNFRIFDVNVNGFGSVTNNPEGNYSLHSFTTGDISTSGNIVLTSNSNVNFSAIVPITLYTNFGEVDFDFFVGGNSAILNNSLYLTIAPNVQSIQSNSNQTYTVYYSNYPNSAILDVSLQYASGITGAIYTTNSVTNLQTGVISGVISGQGILSELYTGQVTGYDSILNINLSTGGSGILSSSTLYASGPVSLSYDLEVTGLGSGIAYENILMSGNAITQASGIVPYSGAFVSVLANTIFGSGNSGQTGVIPNATGQVFLYPTGNAPIYFDPSEYSSGVLISDQCYVGPVTLNYNVIGVGLASGNPIYSGNAGYNFSLEIDPGNYEFYKTYETIVFASGFIPFAAFDPVYCETNNNANKLVSGILSGNLGFTGYFDCSTMPFSIPLSGVPPLIYYQGSLVPNSGVYQVIPSGGFLSTENSTYKAAGGFTRTSISQTNPISGFFNQIVQGCDYLGAWEQQLNFGNLDYSGFIIEEVVIQECNASLNSPNYIGARFYITGDSSGGLQQNYPLVSGVIQSGYWQDLSGYAPTTGYASGYVIIPQEKVLLDFGGITAQGVSYSVTSNGITSLLPITNLPEYGGNTGTFEQGMYLEVNLDFPGQSFSELNVIYADIQPALNNTTIIIPVLNPDDPNYSGFVGKSFSVGGPYDTLYSLEDYFFSGLGLEYVKTGWGKDPNGNPIVPPNFLLPSDPRYSDYVSNEYETSYPLNCPPLFTDASNFLGDPIVFNQKYQYPVVNSFTNVSGYLNLASENDSSNINDPHFVDMKIYQPLPSIYSGISIAYTYESYQRTGRVFIPFTNNTVDSGVLNFTIDGSGSDTKQIALRALSPSIQGFSNPDLMLLSGNQFFSYNDDGGYESWNQTNYFLSAFQLIANNLQPPSGYESAMILNLGTGNYSAIARSIFSNSGNNPNGYAKLELFDLEPANGLFIKDIEVFGSAAPNDTVDCELHYTGQSLCIVPVVAYAGEAINENNQIDYGVIRYSWDQIAQSGQDLYTQTSLAISGISGQTLGYKQGSGGGPGETIIDNDGNVLAQWGGDPQGSGNIETVLINFKQIESSYPNITNVPIQLSAIWYGQSGKNNDITIEFASYFGDLQSYTVSGSTVLDWKPINGGQVVQVIDLPYKIDTESASETLFENCGSFNYSVNLEEASVNFGSGYLGGGSDNINYSLIHTGANISPVLLSYYENGQLIQTNDDWTQSPDYYNILEALGPLLSGSSAIYSDPAYGVIRSFKAQPVIPNTVPEKILLNVDPIYSPTGSNIYAITGVPYFSPIYPSGDFSGFIDLSSNDNAWMSYNMASGFSPQDQKIVAYSVSLLDAISGQDIALNSGIFAPPVILPWEPSGFGIICNTFTLQEIAAKCHSGDFEIDYCVTGTYLTQAEIDQEVKIAEGMITGGTATDGSSTTTSGTLNSQYYYYTGGILYNAPTTGDSITFKSYNGNYSGDFSGSYGYYPTYPEIIKTWTWGQDFNSISGLVNVINTSLYDNSFNIWTNPPCAAYDLIPIFENGPLLQASQAGDNLIQLVSQRPGEAGLYSLVVNSVNPTVISGLTIKTYLTPSIVFLEGRNSSGSAWNIVDYHSGINWEDAAHIFVSGYYDQFQIGSPSTGNPTGVQNTGDNTPNSSGNFMIDVLGQITVSGENNCGTTSTVDITFYKAPFSGSCNPPDGDNDPNPTGNNNNGGDDGNGNVGNPPVFGNVLKTGWKFVNTTGYNYYRVNFSGFEGISPFTQGAPALEFYSTNIDFYDLNGNQDFFYGDTCIEGSKYNAQIFGIASGLLTGTITGQVTINDSGVYAWDNFEIHQTPVLGTSKFNIQPALPYTDFTGYVNGSQIGSALISEQVQGYYYDPVTELVSFSETISGLIVGCGQISGGPYNIINSAAWAAATANLNQYVLETVNVDVSGIVPNVSYTSSGISGFGYLTGILTGYVDGTGSYTFNELVQGIPTTVYQNQLDYYQNASGYISFVSPQEGDQINLNGTILTYSLQSGNTGVYYFSGADSFASIVNNDPILFQASGFSSPIYVTENTTGNQPVLVSGVDIANQGDYLVTLLVESTTGIITQTLTLTVNSGQSYYISGSGNFTTSSGYQIPGYQMFSLVSGISGNDVTFLTTNTTGGINITPFSGGQDVYFPMTSVGTFQGLINETVDAVQNFSGVPISGFISGYLPFATEIREFSNIWDLQTGTRNNMTSFDQSGWFTENIFQYPSGLNNLAFGSPGSFNVGVTYLGSPINSITDVATLIINGINFPSGLQFNITGLS